MGRKAIVLPSATGVAVLAGWLVWLAFGASGPRRPPGDSTSYQPDGAQALYQWAQASGIASRRLYDRTAPLPARATVLLIEPEVQFAGVGDDRYEALLRTGGTLVITGGVITPRPIIPEVSLAIVPMAATSQARAAGGGATFPLRARSRVVARPGRGTVDRDPPEPLLTTPDGEWLAARQRVLGGTVLLAATSSLLSNETLRSPQAAAFVWREVLTPAAGGELLFDHSHYVTPSSQEEAPATLTQLLVTRSWGLALCFAAAVVFVYLLLAGQRLGPPLPPLQAAAAERTMFEQVQAVGGALHRGGQLAFARQHFARHYARRLAERGGQRDAATDEVVQGIERARTAPALVGAVRQAEQRLTAPRPGRGARSGTLSAR